MLMVREITEQDWEVAKKLYCDSFHKNYVATTLPLLGTVLGLYLEEELIGLVQIDWIHDVFDNRKIAYINNFCIQENVRHQGYGDKLLKECISFLENMGVDSIQLTSNKNRVYAHQLYQKNHFEVVDTVFLKKDLDSHSKSDHVI